MTQLSLATVLLPRRAEYVRGTIKPDNLARMRDALTTTKDWPFPPIVVRPLTPPVVRNHVTYTHAVVDGVHRTVLARETKRKTIEATIEKLTDVDADALQLRLNLTHGLLVDKSHRDAWVRRLVKEKKVKVPALAKLLHMTERSVFRMAKGEQTGAGAKQHAAPRTKATTPRPSPGSSTSPAPTPPLWTVDAFFTSLVILSKTAAAHEEAITTYVREHKGKLAWLEKLLDTLSPP